MASEGGGLALLLIAKPEPECNSKKQSKSGDEPVAAKRRRDAGWQAKVEA